MHRIVILCGGLGTRLESVYHKPLNLVKGVPMIDYMISSLHNVNEIHIFYNKELETYGFRQFLLNTFKEITFSFYELPYQTRGPVESVLLGIKQFPFEDDTILFLDNDNIYEGFDLRDVPRDKNFIVCTTNKTSYSHYSFVLPQEDKIVKIVERSPISSYICAGGYGFRNKRECLKYCSKVMNENILNEPYMSNVFQKMMEEGETIYSYFLPNQFTIGTPNDILRNDTRIPFRKLTFVFDLDNTIVSYPNKYKDYSNVSPNKNMISLMRSLKDQGHTIIIHTARKMVSCNGDVDRIEAEVKDTTIETLRNLDVPYDELIFGKPYGDVYIDDKAVNTFDYNLRNTIGFFDLDNYTGETIGMNRYHKFVRADKNSIIKMGAMLDGETFFYKTISMHPLQKWFPRLIQAVHPQAIKIEYVRGAALSLVYSEGLLQPTLFHNLLNVLSELHSSEIDDGVAISQKDMLDHYIEKFEKRSLRRGDFPFTDFDMVYQKIKHFITDWAKEEHPINPVIHGDCWFSNIIYGNQQFYFIDMRGMIHHKLTLKGHMIYDWAKIYQSVIGFDHVINYGTILADDVRDPIEKVYWERCPFDQTLIRKMTAYMLYNTFHSYSSDVEESRKRLIWETLKTLIEN